MTSDQSAERVHIIGAGIAGLAVALHLAKRDIPVTVLEKESCPGGLASSITIGGNRVERFYHFICGPDVELVRLIEEMGLKDKLHWRPCRIGYFLGGRMYAFGTPIDLLRFRPVPFSQRVRFGINVLQSRYRRSWLDLDGIPAKDWLIRQVGLEGYNQIWDPLLKVKFGEYHEQISAAWIWHRIHRVAGSRRKIWQQEHHGYLEGGTETLVNRMVADLRKRGASVQLGTAVERILTSEGRVVGIKTNQSPNIHRCRLLCSTIPLPALLPLIPERLPPPQARALALLKDVEYIGIVCALLNMSRPLTNSFWVNVNDSHVPFNGLIEYTRLNRHFDAGRTHLLYIPFYVPSTDEGFLKPDDVFLDECFTSLKRIEPTFDRRWVLSCLVSRAVNVQPVCKTDFANRVPAKRGPLEGLFVSDSCQLYPEDRTLSGMVRLGTEMAEMVQEEWKQIN
ncbi:MAG: hypothetical protein COS85_21155 [Armatimonadetes bacterium CG07_land_8_20_14_0_80_59_28]|nr:MAG: hypothetical protein COS85_21155 [Armatimonadetes bacterium CG07_land_8_20_14_0_80_59_28]